MISTETFTETAGFAAYKATLPKEPEGDVKKRFVVCCHNIEDMDIIHNLLVSNGTSDTYIPSDESQCVFKQNIKCKKARYLLTPTEVDSIKEHPKVKSVNIDVSYYGGTYRQDPVNLLDDNPAAKFYRYSSTSKHYRGGTTWDGLTGGFANFPGANPMSELPTTATSAELNRSGYQIKRCTQKADPWASLTKINNNGPTSGTYTGKTSTVVIEDRIQQYGDGTGVDIIVCDQAAWYGHVEFINDGNGPTNYIGGNAIDPDGLCGVLDLVLDAPYYIDPAYFDADSNRTVIRWDGTKVPTETAAIGWWESTSNRSAAFSSVDTVSITVTDTQYTRLRCNGTNTAQQSVGSGNNHATPCMSQAYGKTHGWAYNANKWHVNMIGTSGINDDEYFDMCRIFHQNKPLNSTHGTRNPTISSNSWGYRYTLPTTGYYWHRPSAIDGTVTGVSYSNIDPDGDKYTGSTSSPRFLTNFYQSTIRMPYVDNYSLDTGEEMIDAGVIFICSAGNTRQKLVKSDHPDYNNYVSTSSNSSSLASTAGSGSFRYYKTINRQGYPGQIGQLSNGTYRTIPIGAFDVQYEYTTVKERRAIYSNMGNLISCYVPGEDSIAAEDWYGNNPGDSRPRYDSTYRIDSSYNIVTSGGTQSATSYTSAFSGTSSASPVAAGLIATKLQYNRDWTYADVLNWIETDVGTNSDMYTGSEATTANDSNWSDIQSLQGGFARILWDAPLTSSASDAQYYSPEGKLTDHFITERWFVDQYIGDRLCTWGTNANGQLGNGNQSTDTGSFYGIYFIDNTSYDSWSDVKCGGDHTLAVTREKILYSWGKNFDGQLGNGTTNSTDEPSLTSLGSNFNRIKLISAGLQHSLAISTQKVLYAWGHNANGQLGLGNNNSTSTPTTVGTTYNWVQVSGKGFHTVAIKDDGTIWSTGYNQYGQLGLGDTTDRNTFTQIGDDTDWLTVSAGRNHTLAIKTNGTLWAWGANHIGTDNNVNEGILGIGAGSISYSTPQQVGNDISWISISAGGYHSAAIKRDGSLYCWGRNDDGQLGDNSQTSKNIPTLVYADNTSLTASIGYEINLAQWKNVSCGEDHTTAVKLNGSAWAWGDNSNRQLGYNTLPLNIFKYPHKVEGSGDDWIAQRGRHFESVKRVSAGRKHSAFVTSGSSPEYYVTQG